MPLVPSPVRYRIVTGRDARAGAHGAVRVRAAGAAERPERLERPGRRSGRSDSRWGQCRRPRTATPSGIGGSPPVVHRRVDHATRCGPRSPSTGVQEARISTSTSSGRSARAPKLCDSTRVTVPPAACAATPAPASASGEPGPGDLAQEPVGCDLGLEGAAHEADHPEGAVPGRPGPAGSCRTTKRPDARPSSSCGRRTSPVSATDHGAIRAGTGDLLEAAPRAAGGRHGASAGRA